MEQNTKEWLDWRKGGIGASDVPIILGLSPYKRAYDLFLEKTGQKEDDNKNKDFIFQKGHAEEIRSRAIYEMLQEANFLPALFQREDSPHFRASIDGYNKELNKMVEFKYVGSLEYSKNEIPEKHYPQLQWQMFITGIKKMDYAQITDHKPLKIIPCEFNEKYLFEILPKVESFWECVQKKEWLTIDQKLESLFGQYADLKKEMDLKEENLEKIKKEIFSMVKEEKYIWKNFKVETVTRKGGIDYESIPELKVIDLEKYRKKDSTFRQIKVLK